MTSGLLQAKMKALLSEAEPSDLADEAAIDGLLERSSHAWTYGGNTSCLELAFDDQVFILDAGTGLRGLSNGLMADPAGADKKLHVFFTHFHWDHICGLPFFVPIYQPGREINVWSGRSDADKLLEVQMSSAHFPVKWKTLPSTITCTQLPEGEATPIAGAQVRILPLLRPDKAFGYRVDCPKASVCYLTDTEVSKNPNQLAPVYADFVEGADVVVVDAMYGFLEYHERINFGHSTIFNWIDFFAQSDIGELVIFHHDPNADDEAVTRLLNSAKRYHELVAPNSKWKLSAAREGQEWRWE
jgi:phosphoribosyl 1,2-cyclic phosphodiesterase